MRNRLKSHIIRSLPRRSVRGGSDLYSTPISSSHTISALIESVLMISQRLLRAVSWKYGRVEMRQRGRLSILTGIRVRDMMNRPVVTARPDEKVDAVAARMADFEVGSAIVVDDGKPVGIVTDGDIVTKAVVTDSSPDEISVKDIMSTPIRMIDGEADIAEAARIMTSFRIKRLGVSEDSQLVGIVSVSDLVSVTPEIMSIISEKTRITTGESISGPKYFDGYCDSCSRWSEYLIQVDGRFLCDECRTEESIQES